MMLVDRSIRADHLRVGDSTLIAALDNGRVLMLPFVLGELACGNLRNRLSLLELLGALPTVAAAKSADVLLFIDQAQFAGRGIGYVEVHLLASARLAGVPLWTRDRRLDAVAMELGLAAR